MPNPLMGPEYDLSQRIKNIEAALLSLALSPSLLNASTGQGTGSPGVTIDTYGVHAFNSSGVEVTTISSSDGTIRVTYPNGTIQIKNDGADVPGIVFTWTQGTVQSAAAEIFSTESGLTMASPMTNANGQNFSYINLNDVNAEVWTGGNSGPRMLNLGNNSAWQVGNAANGYATVYGNPDGSWVLGKTGGNQVYANATGATQITGGLTVTGTKNFSMQHPLDPTKNLVHASTESPVNGVEYWGEATIGADGTIIASLPSYFEALTKPTGRNIQLTPVGGPCASVPWASAITNGQFTINGPAGVKINWMVKAERQQIVKGTDVLAFEVEAAASGAQPVSPAV